MGKKTEFIYLSEPDMIQAGVLDSKRCVEVMDETFKLLGEGDYLMGGTSHNEHGQLLSFPDEPKFENMPANGPDRRFMTMMAYLGGRFCICGEKWYGSNIANPARGLPRSVLMVMLNDPDTCEPVALMSANLISSMRTGCVPGVGVKYLARKDAEVCAVIGAGPISRACLRGIAVHAANLKKIVVYDLRPEASQQFVDWAREELKLDGEVADSTESAVREGDIVSFATSALKPVIVMDEWIKKGALCICTGNAGFDIETVKRSRLIFDNPIMHDSWVRETPKSVGTSSLYGMSANGIIPPFKDMPGLGPIAAGREQGRVNDDEIIIFQTGGMPVEDVAWGYDVFQRAKAMGLGQVLKLWDEPYMK